MTEESEVCLTIPETTATFLWICQAFFVLFNPFRTFTGTRALTARRKQKHNPAYK